MDIEIDIRDLARAIGAVQSIPTVIANPPILSHVLISAEDVCTPVLHVSATDLAMSVTAHVPARVHRDGAIALPATTIAGIVARLPDGHVRCSASDHEATITIGRVRYRIPGYPRHDYPLIVRAPGETVWHALSSDVLGALLRSVVHAAALDERDHTLTGVLIECAGDPGYELRAVATDGARLACCALGSLSGFTLREALIPRKGVRVLAELARAAAGGSVHIATHAGYLMARAADIDVAIKLVRDPFPDFRQALSEQPSRWVIVHRRALIECLRRISIVADEPRRAVQLTVGGRVIGVSASRLLVGDGAESIDVAESVGDPLVINASAQYLLDALSPIEDDYVRMAFRGPHDAITITPASGTTYRAMVMPIAWSTI